MKKRILAFILTAALLIAGMPSTFSQAASSLAAPKVTIKTTSTNNPKMSWKAVDGADGYGIYRKTSSDKKYVKVATTKKLTYTDKKWSADAGSTVKYYVKAYSKDADGKTVWGKQSSAKNWSVPGKVKKSLTPVPTAKPTPTPTPKVTKSSSYMVWIPTNGGKKYHCKETCSGMIKPKLVTVEEAKRLGFDACGRCKP